AELKNKQGELIVELQKTKKRCTIIYFIIVVLLISSLLVLIGFYLYYTGRFDSLTQAIVPFAVVLSMLSYSCKNYFINKFSRKIRKLNEKIAETRQKINVIYDLEYKNVEEDTKIIESINNLPRAESIEDLPIEKDKPIQIITKIIGLLSLFIGGSSAIASTTLVDEIHPAVFIIMLVMGIWLHIYGYFAIFTKRPIWSMYWPSMAIGSIAIPPLVLLFITISFQEWVYAISTILGAVIGLTLFTLMMIYKVYKPNKAKRKFLEDNRGLLYTIDTSNLENYHYKFEMRNLKNDYVWSKIFTNIKHVNVLMKYVEGKYIFIEEIRAVEILNANYESAKKLIDLYNEDDGRPIYQFAESIVDENTLNIERLSEKLNELEFLKDKIDVVDNTITISFNAYLTVYWSDDYCGYLDTHFHPTLFEGVEFVQQLINEDIVFVLNKITKRWKSFPGYLINELIRKNERKQTIIFSAVKIYKE
ncbi:MAG: hypothetical protein LBM99_06645, partial [Bacillales bacterium]|nr:hypothetical protein [Bacillales bacterium]